MQDLHSYICVGYCKGTMPFAAYPPTYSQKVTISRGAWIPKMDMGLFWCSNAVNSCQYSNPRRACAARVIMLVYVCTCTCTCVCLSSVSSCFGITSYVARYQRLRPNPCACVCVRGAALGAELTSTRSTRSVYLEGTRSHNEGYVSTPPCYLLF